MNWRVRERIAGIYDRRLGNLLDVPTRVPDSTSAWAIYAVLLRDAAQREPGAGGVARGRGADGDLLSEAAASAARLCRRSMTGRAAGFGWAGDADPGAADPSGSVRRGCRAGLRRRGARTRLTQPGSATSVSASMTEQKPPEELPPAGDHPAHNATGTTPHGIPKGPWTTRPLAAPTSDRQATEIAPAKIEKDG